MAVAEQKRRRKIWPMEIKRCRSKAVFSRIRADSKGFLWHREVARSLSGLDLTVEIHSGMAAEGV